MPNTFVSDAKFRELAQGDAKSEGVSLRKQFVAEIKAESDARVLTFTISTASVDRAGDTIDAKGWRLESYRKNPVVLWAHDYTSLPVARSLKEWSNEKTLHSSAEFTPAGMARFNDTVYEMYKQGFLSAVSVGFAPSKWAWSDDKGRAMGIDFKEQELLEYSCVPVPANGEALIEARSAGVDIEPITEWAGAIIRRKCSTIRDFEEWLRDAGYSRSDAKALASHGWNGLTQRDAEIRQTVDFLQQFRSALQ